VVKFVFASAALNKYFLPQALRKTQEAGIQESVLSGLSVVKFAFANEALIKYF
jgi:hypothetical protein